MKKLILSCCVLSLLFCGDISEIGLNAVKDCTVKDEWLIKTNNLQPEVILFKECGGKVLTIFPEINSFHGRIKKKDFECYKENGNFMFYEPNYKIRSQN